MTSSIHQPFISPISDQWYEAIENIEQDATPGTRFLVRRHHGQMEHRPTIIDYVTVRTEDGWKHVTVGYFQGERTPYPAHYDGNRYHRAPRRLVTGISQSVSGRIFLQQDESFVQ